MAMVFVVVSMRPEMDGRLAEAVKSTFPSDYYHLGRNEWLVAATGTAREVSDRIGITGIDPATIGSSVVFAISGYYGRAPSDTWECIAAKLGGHIIG